jgi:TonB family protein
MKPITGILLLVLFTHAHNLCAQKNKSIQPIDTTYCTAYDTSIQIAPEKAAQFQQGDLAKFSLYVGLHVRYPSAAIQNKLRGKSYIQFVVDWNGKVKNVHLLKSSGHKMLDAEAVRVVKQSPVWTPAKNKDVCVPQQFVIPVQFLSLGVINRN